MFQLVLQESLSPVHRTLLMWGGVWVCGCGDLIPRVEGVVLQAQCQHS